MKFVKRAGAVMLTAVLLMTGLQPLSVYADNRETLDTYPGSVYYQVKRGDCLSVLAERFGVRLSDLEAANNLGADGLLVEGRRLRIPSSQGRYYTVRQGDTLWRIARQFGVAVSALESMNHIVDGDILAAGKNLIIPQPGSVISEDEETDPEVEDYYLVLPSMTVWPVTGLVSSEFGQRWGRQHEGLDIATEESSPIRALEAGTVVFAGRRGTYGNTIIINHGHGFRSLYAHASSLEVSAGEYVEQGQTIARVGSTGHSTGPHLHLELLYRGTPLNPEEYLPTEDWRI